MQRKHTDLIATLSRRQTDADAVYVPPRFLQGLHVELAFGLQSPQLLVEERADLLEGRRCFGLVDGPEHLRIFRVERAR